MAAKRSKGVVDAGTSDHTRVNARLSHEAYRRLSVHALMAGVTPGKYLERLITEHCREWRIQSNPSGNNDRLTAVESASQATLAAPI